MKTVKVILQHKLHKKGATDHITIIWEKSLISKFKYCPKQGTFVQLIPRYFAEQIILIPLCGKSDWCLIVVSSFSSSNGSPSSPVLNNETRTSHGICKAQQQLLHSTWNSGMHSCLILCFVKAMFRGKG